MSGHEEALLTELCTICHEQPPKYRCPRCSARTCSLPCTKRHKLWSQCSGVRDPATYVKKNDLATPAAFDMDFNFITGIERKIERADREVEDRQIHLDRVDGTSQKKPDFVKGDSAFRKATERSGVKVAKAPKGMMRSKQNSSRFLQKKKKCICWTIEWIFADERRRFLNSLETDKVAAGYWYTQSKEESKKRKLDLPNSHDHWRNSKTPRSQERPDENESKAIPITTSNAHSDPAPPSPQQPSRENNSLAEKQNKHSVEPEDETPSGPFFYLHRPQARSKLPVLVPISPKATFKDVLHGRLVLEFPTIYVLMESPESVSRDRFILEEEYILKEREGLEVLDELEEDGNDGNLSEEGEVAENQPQWDEKKVLEVLKRDLESHGAPG